MPTKKKNDTTINESNNDYTNTDSESVLAKSDDGTIQITLTFPFDQIDKLRQETLLELAKDVEIPGFRKGKAPLTKVSEKISQNSLIEKTLSKILPKAFGDAIRKHKINPTVYPKFELIKATDGEDWQVRAITCEFPKIDLGEYKQEISNIAKTSDIWTPDKGDLSKTADKKPTRDEIEQNIVKILVKNAKIQIPKVLIDEEINSRLSKLLERIEKLGITLEGYLASIGKTVDQLRTDYHTQAEEAIKLDFILIKIAELEKVVVTEAEIESAIQASSTADPKIIERLNTPDQRRIIETILKRRKVIDNLASLAS
jgi:trigger factor